MRRIHLGAVAFLIIGCASVPERSGHPIPIPPPSRPVPELLAQLVAPLLPEDERDHRHVVAAFGRQTRRSVTHLTETANDPAHALLDSLRVWPIPVVSRKVAT